LLAKCRYSAASLTCSRAASAAVVMLAARLFQHRGQGLQDLDPPLARLGAFSARRLGGRFGVFGNGTGFEVGHGGSGARVRFILAQPLSGFVRRRSPATEQAWNAALRSR